MKMLKFPFYWFMGLMLLVSACGDDNIIDDDDEPTPTETAARTVLAYMVGDNQSSGASDLSSLLKVNLDSMKVGMKSVDSSDCNLLVYSKLSGSNYSYLIRLENENSTVVADTLYSYSDVNPLSQSTMLSVIQTTFSLYPAESYGLVFLSHAEGWVPASTSASRSIGMYHSTSMDIADFQEVLSTSGYHLDYILFDACFMSSVEVAYELRNEVDYIIGSPTEIPGPGADYSAVVPALFLANDYAEGIADAYYQPYAEKYTGNTPTSNENWTGGVSISVIATANLENLASSTRQILSAYAYDNDLSDIMYYDRRSTRYYYDLDGLINHLTGGNSDYTTWRTAFDAAVPYWQTTARNYSSYGGMFSMDGASGVSTFISRSSTSSSTLTFYQSYDWSVDTTWLQ